MSTKSDVLAILERNRDRDVSGQELAESLGVSRTAVWKAIKAIREDGYEVTAVTKRGYRLADKEILSKEGITARMTKPVPVIVFGEIDSTNAEAKRLIAAGACHGTVIAADMQTAGRGRSGKSFYSPGGTGLYMSVILRPDYTDIRDAQMITVAAAVVTARAIEKLSGRSPGIKWVNDLFLDGKKICGILTEAVSDFESGKVESIVVGIGVNCVTDEFPPELGGIAGAVGDRSMSRNHLAALIAEGLIDAFQNLTDPEIIREYRERSVITGKRIVYTAAGEERTGTVTGINDRGNLVVRDGDGGETVVSSGEIRIVSWQ
jgi:BirA family biotin operon repressor/biotin-[acetyl-CoA-carboxylase] ligase